MMMRPLIGSTSGTLCYARTPNWAGATAYLTQSRFITSVPSRQCSTITSNNMPLRYKHVCASAAVDHFAVNDCQQRFDVSDLIHRAREKIFRDDDQVGQFTRINRAFDLFFK